MIILGNYLFCTAVMEVVGNVLPGCPKLCKTLTDRNDVHRDVFLDLDSSINAFFPRRERFLSSHALSAKVGNTITLPRSRR